MLLKECYDSFGGSYETIMQRLPREETVKKFALKFLSDPSFGDLHKALECGDYERAFLAAHSLKGVSSNLAFARLSISSGELTELLRDRESRIPDEESCRELFERVTTDYEEVTKALMELEQNSEADV